MEFLIVLSVCFLDSKDRIEFLYLFFFLLISISVTEKAKVEIPYFTDAVKYKLNEEGYKQAQDIYFLLLPPPQRVTGEQCSSP